mmetsp:Transcript_42699/g.65535  ORF Transcript_42699/g.65535 Transcript_42699/m.65535 type:complete len:202 (+) Transcript_42699:137-742(+)|eukprot:CAMPEP_0170486852 /NCGR_PEP_ID=MMETSP0208-20121228/5777_1 /TAXON_ID=197538 /ORGANISM="Strombidium inclinatum, Strain S3" /LENGTH=201 /DNA_ID=CAMNT_0010760929 /DNA_START=103 /DNA_END=708 /DNA_ORIENTATION=+
MEDDQIDSFMPVRMKTKVTVENNLITVSGDQVRVLAYDPDTISDPEGVTADSIRSGLELRAEFNLNDKIVDILKVPTASFKDDVTHQVSLSRHAGANKQRRMEARALKGGVNPDDNGFPLEADTDFIFILTEQLHCFLFGFNVKTQQPQLISKGFLKEMNYKHRERPYPLFLSFNEKFIVLMIAEYTIKVIPINASKKTKI